MKFAGFSKITARRSTVRKGYPPLRTRSPIGTFTLASELEVVINRVLRIIVAGAQIGRKRGLTCLGTLSLRSALIRTQIGMRGLSLLCCG